MRLPIAVLLLTLTTACSAAEPPPFEIPKTLARYASKPPIEDYYPAASRDLKEQGTTKIRLCYDEQGMPQQVMQNESSGFERLDEAAVLWGMALRITPGIRRGRPQPACVEIPVKFSLEKSQEPPLWPDELMPPMMPLVLPPTDLPPPRPPVVPIPLAPSPPDKAVPL